MFNVSAESITKECSSWYLITSNWYDWELQITGKCTDSVEELYSRVYALTRNSLSDKREYARRHRKRGVNAQPPAARQGRGAGAGAGAAARGKGRSGAAITPPPTIAAHAGNSDAPRRSATATCRRHLLCGNPSTWPKQSYGVCSNIKVDNVHNPTWPGAIQRMQTRAHVRLTVRVYSRYEYRVSLCANTLSCDDSSNWRESELTLGL